MDDGRDTGAIAGAREAGATEFVVSDSHGNGQNLLIDRFPADVRIVRSMPRPLGMMEGIDSTFDVVLFIGYHASTDNLAGVRAHTFSSATLASVALNGSAMMEAGVARRASLKPLVVRTPVRLDLVFKNYRPAELLAYLPNVQRTTSHGIRFVGRDMIEVSRFIEFLNTYQAGLTP